MSERSSTNSSSSSTGGERTPFPITRDPTRVGVEGLQGHEPGLGARSRVEWAVDVQREPQRLILAEEQVPLVPAATARTVGARLPGGQVEPPRHVPGQAHRARERGGHEAILIMAEKTRYVA